ncbi:hypothetical protein [Campylobacter pinnipediorum]|uniref:Uncharacterized protein n=1 Tax=Campylobacter pinnipediorum subsp. pinnipediorum TaxID=1660067 RepID=A0AAX0L9K9_9BACT|nr:hypothetical protein [Campylobacter pinnipediorum]AQW81286.1 hypothetical protein CPIN17260_0992 [Campylobacter pinnipediorum subsp. pinnipediorum]AQW82912.1 hypothetical protein CPIN17261_0903 [Campylobacter pinnipediorum subsp. pinnipediorum]OPA77255.1 hypothetical protein BFG04_03940 [Campylobacter pinnipediorum subsp. pinnipediorum]
MQEIRELNITKPTHQEQPPKNQRSEIISGLKQHLSELNYNIEVFEIYVFDKETLPLIVIKDSDDDVDVVSFETIRHTLSVSIILIDTSYTKNDELVKEVLHKMKSFNSKFNTKILNAINRSTIQVLDKDYVATELKVTFTYQTELWSL